MENAYLKFVSEMGKVLESQKANVKEDDKMADAKIKQAKAEANAYALYVKGECETNPDFAKQVNAEWKSAQRMMNFVRDKARQLLISGECVMVDHHTVFDWVNDYYFLDDKEEVEAQIRKEREAKEKAELAAKIKAEAEAKAKAEAEEILADDEAYQNASDEEKKKLLNAKISDLKKKAERKARADAKKAKKAAEERSKAIKRLEEAGAITDSTPETEKEKMIEQTIKKLRKEEREAKKKAKEEAKAKAEAETKANAEAESEIEPSAEAKSEAEVKAEPVVEAQAEPNAEAEVKEPTLIDKAAGVLSKCKDANAVIKLYKHSSLSEFSERELDNLVTHEAQVLERFGTK